MVSRFRENSRKESEGESACERARAKRAGTVRGGGAPGTTSSRLTEYAGASSVSALACASSIVFGNASVCDGKK